MGCFAYGNVEYGIKECKFVVGSEFRYNFLGDYDKLPLNQFVNDYSDKGDVLLEPNGYLALSHGIIVQWGNVSLSQDGTETVTFPVAFPSACVSVMFQGTEDSASYTNGIYLSSKSASNFVVKTRSDAQTCYWLALGY